MEDYETWRLAVNDELQRDHNIELELLEKLLGKENVNVFFESAAAPHWAATEIWELALESNRLMRMRAVAKDETGYWSLEERLMQHVERIETVYIYDMLRETNCCEITPSRWLAPVDTRAVLKEGVDDDWLIDEIHDAVASNRDWEGMYIHTYKADKMKGVDLGYRIVPEDMDYDGAFAEEEEYYMSNVPF